MMFLNPSALILMVILPLLAFFLWWRARLKQRRFINLGEDDLIKSLLVNYFQRRMVFQHLLWSTCLIALIIALARPVWGTELQLIETKGVSIVFLLDVSRSMSAQDIPPNRLERAKRDIGYLVDKLNGNEFALIPFARSAFVYTPATTDANAFLNFLNIVDTNTISQQGTAIDRGLEVALQTFAERIGIQPLIIVLSDGENTEGDPIPILEKVIEEGIVVHTIGYGTEDGAAIPIYDALNNLTTYQSDEAGNLIFSRLGEAQLQAIAERTGGLYLHSLRDSLDTLIEYINQEEIGALGNRIVARPIERFGLFLLIAFVALTIEMLIPFARFSGARHNEN